MSQTTIEERTPKRRLTDDYDVLHFARELNSKLKASDWFFSLVYSEVDRVDEGFYITPNLKIAVASLRHIKENEIPDDVLEDIYYAALSHENAHAIAFPFMTRINLTYAVVHGYCKERGVKFDTGVFNTVENIVSDIFNELVIYTHKLEGYKQLPKLRYYYIYRPSRDSIAKKLSNRAKLEKDPVEALFTTHNVVFTSVFQGRLKSPRVPKPAWLSEHIYNVMYKTAKAFRVRNHIELLVGGGFSSVISTLVGYYDLYSAVDKLYKEISRRIENGKVRLDENEFLPIERIIVNANLADVHGQYWSYYLILITLYRYTIEHPENARNLMKCRNVDSGESRPAPPSPDVLDDILNQLRGGREILSPKMADFVARRLLSTALLTSKTTFETVQRSGTIKVPWYRRPRGKIDPLSLLKPSVLDWRVQVSYSVPEYRRSKSLSVSVPDQITAIIDESGSTSSVTSILSPIVGIDITVFDVERTTIMSLLYNVLRFSDRPKTTLIRFSSDVIVEEGTVRDIYERLMNIQSSEVTWGSTEIELAVSKGVEVHRDKPTNYFLLATDMEITESQARAIKRVILSEIRRSPVLVLAVNSDVPSTLTSLNRYPNIAVVSVKSMADYPKLEEAIKKLARLLVR